VYCMLLYGRPIKNKLLRISRKTNFAFLQKQIGQ